ncbi:hypothetical protein L7F22_021863 [Adiantum nelumboides]|nr:hypothetical protein [Adiantum nelumboides]
MVPSPAAQDCARHDHSSGLAPGDGLLPIPPLIHGQARVLSKRSSQSKVSSALTPPNSLSRMFQESSPPRMIPKIPRSASAILPTPSVGSPPTADGLLKGRLPFKVVQDNGPGNTGDHMQSNAPKKSNNQRHGFRKKITITNSRSSNSKAGSNPENSKSTSKQFQDGSLSGGQYKETNARIRKSLERRNSAKGDFEKVEMKTDFPVITILQRPKTNEAAVELFAKFFKSGTQQCLGHSDGMEAMSIKSKKLGVVSNDGESEDPYAGEELSESESSDGSIQKIVSNLSSASSVEYSSDVEQFSLVGAGDITGPIEGRTPLVGDNLLASKAPVLEVGCEELSPWERWAGPSYINSPPPSALPLPRFSKKHLKVVAYENTCAERMEEINQPSSISPLYSSLTRQRYLNINSDAVATATKDLKRILNLDLCRL